MPKRLTLVSKTDPILREVMPTVAPNELTGLTDIIDNMIYSIRPEQLIAAACDSHSAAGMAANQWGIAKRVFLYTPDGSADDKRLEVMVNPSYEPCLRPGETEPAKVPAFEGCFSVPMATGIVNRYECIKVKYQSPDGEFHEKILTGWEARVFQHETDHLDGKLYDGALDGMAGPECWRRFQFQDAAEREAFWEEVVRPSREGE